jgi:hypothetical protein
MFCSGTNNLLLLADFVLTNQPGISEIIRRQILITIQIHRRSDNSLFQVIRNESYYLFLETSFKLDLMQILPQLLG